MKASVLLWGLFTGLLQCSDMEGGFHYGEAEITALPKAWLQKSNAVPSTVLLLVALTNSDSVWEETTGGHQFQEARITGGK